MKSRLAKLIASARGAQAGTYQAIQSRLKDMSTQEATAWVKLIEAHISEQRMKSRRR